MSIKSIKKIIKTLPDSLEKLKPKPKPKPKRKPKKKGPVKRETKDYLVETVCIFRHRYIVHAKNSIDARDNIMNNLDDYEAMEVVQFSQLPLKETLNSVREIDDSEFARLLAEDNSYLHLSVEDGKKYYLNVVDYTV